MLKSDHHLYPYEDREGELVNASGSASASGGGGLEAAEAPDAAAVDGDQFARFAESSAPPVNGSSNAHRPTQTARHLDALYYSKMMKTLSKPMDETDREVFMEVSQGGGGKSDHSLTHRNSQKHYAIMRDAYRYGSFDLALFTAWYVPGRRVEFASRHTLGPRHAVSTLL